MAVRNIIAAITALAASAGAGGAYFVARSPAAPAPSAHSTVLVETKEAPAEPAAAVKIEAGGKKVEVQRGKGSSAVRVESGSKASKVEVKRTNAGDEDVSAGDVKVQRKGKGLNVKVGDLVVDTSGH
jgi:hypothetical protein